MMLRSPQFDTQNWLRGLDEFFADTFLGDGFPEGIRLRTVDDGWVLEADVPGLRRDQIKLEVNEDKLRLKLGEREEFRLQLGDKIEADKIEARMDLGILQVRLPKAAEFTNHIEIQ